MFCIFLINHINRQKELSSIEQLRKIALFEWN
jgi:hypothetical protein